MAPWVRRGQNMRAGRLKIKSGHPPATRAAGTIRRRGGPGCVIPLRFASFLV
jgi:hypothetical protein